MTFEIVFTVVVLAGLLGVTAAYAMARRNFPGKRLVMLLFLMPLIVPPITYGIPLATVLYQTGVGGTFWGVVLANLVPTVPFVILVMIPFIEQIDPHDRGGGARLRRRHVAAVLARAAADAAAGDSRGAPARSGADGRHVRADASSPPVPPARPLVVVLYYSVFAAGVRAVQSIDAMAVVYMVTTLIWLLIALRFVNPTQIVARVKLEQAR